MKMTMMMMPSCAVRQKTTQINSHRFTPVNLNEIKQVSLVQHLFHIFIFGSISIQQDVMNVHETDVCLQMFMYIKAGEQERKIRISTSLNLRPVSTTRDKTFLLLSVNYSNS